MVSNFHNGVKSRLASFKESMVHPKVQISINCLLTDCFRIGPCAHSDWSKTHVLSEYKTKKKCVLVFCVCTKIYILKQMKKPKPCITL